MSDDTRKLLAGYATGTLTAVERQALFTAALSDEELFAAISDEEPLRELLADPAVRAELLARLHPAPVGFAERFAAWLRTPGVVTGFGAAAVGVLVISLVPLLREQRTGQPATVARSVIQSSAPQITAAPELQKDAAKAKPGPAERTATALTRPAAAPRRIEVAPAAATPPSALVMNQQAAAQPAEVAGGAASPSAAPLPVLRPPFAAPPSAGMTALPREAAEGRADAPRLVAAAKPVPQAATSARITVLRKNASGDYTEADPAKTVFSAGDTVRIRIGPGGGGLVRVQGATPQPIIQQLTEDRAFETGDILLGAQDMRLVISFSQRSPVMRTLADSLPADGMQAKSAQPAEIILRIKKP